MIDISEMDRREVLAALYNNARGQGLGLLQCIAADMTTDEASEVLAGGGARFDYLHGRVLKVNLEGRLLDPRLYDRDNGQGAAARALAGLVSDNG